MRLIDADALIERMCEFVNNDWNRSLGGLFTDAVDTCIDFAEDAETIEAVPVVHGEWVPDDRGVYYCSVCDSEAYWTEYGQQLVKYCPECGADMRRKE